MDNYTDVIVNLIFASDLHQGIGIGNTIPWKSKYDMTFFKETTTGFPIIMGRKTWESLNGRMLPNRPHIVITRQANYPVVKHPDFFLATDIEDAIKIAIKVARNNSVNQVFVIGGAQIYEQSMPYIDRIYHSTIYREENCDVFFSPDMEGFAPYTWIKSNQGLPSVMNGEEPGVMITQAIRIQSMLNKPQLKPEGYQV